MDLRLQLQGSKKGDLIIDVYILRMKMITDHLATIVLLILDHDMVYYALSSLDSNCNSFIFVSLYALVLLSLRSCITIIIGICKISCLKNIEVIILYKVQIQKTTKARNL